MAVAVVAGEHILRAKTASDVGNPTTGAASVPRRIASVHGVEQQATLRRRATVRQMGRREVGRSMESKVVGDQVGIEVVTRDMVRGTQRKTSMNRGSLRCWSGKSTWERGMVMGRKESGYVTVERTFT